MAEWRIDERGELKGERIVLTRPLATGEIEVEVDLEEGVAYRFIPFTVLQAYVRFHEDAKARAWEAEGQLRRLRMQPVTADMLPEGALRAARIPLPTPGMNGDWSFVEPTATKAELPSRPSAQPEARVRIEIGDTEDGGYLLEWRGGPDAYLGGPSGPSYWPVGLLADFLAKIDDAKAREWEKENEERIKTSPRETVAGLREWAEANQDALLADIAAGRIAWNDGCRPTGSPTGWFQMRSYDDNFGPVLVDFGPAGVHRASRIDETWMTSDLRGGTMRFADAEPLGWLPLPPGGGVQSDPDLRAALRFVFFRLSILAPGDRSENAKERDGKAATGAEETDVAEGIAELEELAGELQRDQLSSTAAALLHGLDKIRQKAGGA